MRGRSIVRYGVLCLVVALGSTACQPSAEKSGETIRQVQTENTYSDNLRLKAINEEIAAEPTNPIPWAKRAELYLKAGDAAAATADARQAMRLDSNRADSYTLLASAYRAGRHIDSAIICINQAKRRGYASPELYVSSGEILLILRRYSESLDELNEALRLAPENAKAHFYKGLVYEERGDTTKAIDEFQRTVALNPEYADGHNKLALLYMRRHNYPMARQHLETGLRFAPEDAFVNFNFGMYYKELNQPDSALAYFKKAVFFEPSMYLANYQLGMDSYRQRNYLEAANRLEAALQYNPRLADARFYLALCRENLGSTQEAIDQYKVVIDQNQGFVKESRTGLARINARLNHRQLQEEDEALADTLP